VFPADGEQLGGPLVVAWDNLNSHVSQAMIELVTARARLTVYLLPPYAHGLNPVEPVWSHLKRSLANLAKRKLSQLTALIKTRLKRMHYRPGLLGRRRRRHGVTSRSAGRTKDAG
jgi:transposase